MSTIAQRNAAKVRGTKAPRKPLPIGKALVEFGAGLPDLFANGTEAEVIRAGQTILALKKGILAIQSTFDKLVDMRDMGTFGKDHLPNVKRLRVKSDSVGRPKKEKAANPLLSLEV